MSWSRPVSPLERAWLVADARFPPFVNQLVLEGEGQPDLGAWTDAVARAAEVNPGARVVLRGAVCRARWVDTGQAPPVREVDGSAWDARSPDGAPFLRDPLDPVTGPTSEVLLVRGPIPRVVLRTAHATMDGGGTLAWAADVGRALRDEPLTGHADTLTDHALAHRLSGPARRPHPDDALPALGGRPVADDNVTWVRRTVPGAPSHALGRVAVATARHARAVADDPGAVRVDVPCDLRRAGAEVRATANLTGVVALEVPEGFTPEDVTRALREAVAGGVPQAVLRGLGVLGHLPLSWIRAGSEAGGRRQLRTGRFGSTAVLSNLGRLDVAAFRGGGFTPRLGFFVPPGTPVTALFVALAGGPDGVEVVAAAPRALAAEGRLEAWMDAVAAELAR